VVLPFYSFVAEVKIPVSFGKKGRFSRWWPVRGKRKKKKRKLLRLWIISDMMPTAKACPVYVYILNMPVGRCHLLLQKLPSSTLPPVLLAASLYIFQYAKKYQNIYLNHFFLFSKKTTARQSFHPHEKGKCCFSFYAHIQLMVKTLRGFFFVWSFIPLR